MAYTPFTWADGASGGTPITAARLNALENGLGAAQTVFPASTAVTYDTSGNVATVTIDGITTTYTYNAAGNVATDSRTVGAVTTTRTYTYDAVTGALTGIEED